MSQKLPHEYLDQPRCGFCGRFSTEDNLVTTRLNWEDDSDRRVICRECINKRQKKKRPCDYCGTPTEDYWQGRVDDTGAADTDVWCGCKEGEHGSAEYVRAVFTD